MTVAPAQASKSVTVQPAGMWARRAYISLSTDGDAQKLGVQYQKQGSSAWTDPQTADALVDGGTKTLTVLGLEPGTNYTFRAVYNKYQSEATEVFTTEVEQQVGNAGFEEWTMESFKLSSVWPGNWTFDWYRPSSVWAVNSKKTMPGYYSNAFLDKYSTNFPCASYSTDKFGGEKSAVIYTVHVKATEFDVTSAGEIFIGSADDKGNHQSEGCSLGSRPSAVNFAYKFIPNGNETYYVEIVVKDEEGNTIGNVVDISGSESLAWDERKININYSDLTKKANSLYIIFKSTSSSNPGYSKTSMEIAGTNYDDCNIGSKLFLDDIELIYE